MKEQKAKELKRVVNPKPKFETYIFEKTDDEAKRHSLLQTALRNHLGSETAELLYNPKGKPYTKSQNGVFISVAVAGEVMICVIAEAPIGIDGECFADYVDHKIDYVMLAERFFTEDETEYVRDGEGINEVERFLNIWIRKEAYVKYNGKGLSDFSNFSVSDGEKIYARVSNIPIRMFKPSIPGEEDYIFAIAGDVVPGDIVNEFSSEEKAEREDDEFDVGEDNSDD